MDNALIIGLAGPGSALLIYLLGRWYDRRAKRAAETAPVRLTPPSWEEFQTFAEEQRRDIAALVNVVRDIADQSTGQHFTINAESLARLKGKGYIPTAWLPAEDDAA